MFPQSCDIISCYGATGLLLICPFARFDFWSIIKKNAVCVSGRWDLGNSS